MGTQANTMPKPTGAPHKTASDTGIYPTAERKPLALTLAVGQYDRTRAIIEGKVQPESIVLKTDAVYVGEFCTRPVYEQYDAAEMSLSWYVAARSRNEPVIALPIFPLRMPVHAFLFCRSDSPYKQPRDLLGKRLGTTRYRWTVNLWIRGIFQEHYGLRPEDFSWVTTEEEGAGYIPPPDLKIKCLVGQDVEQLLLDRQIDALLTPVVPPIFRRGDERIRRLFLDCRSEITLYFQRTGIFPITHTVVVGESLWNREPWIGNSIIAAFEQAQWEADQSYDTQPTPLSFPEGVLLLEEQRAKYGAKAWAHGVDSNRHILETFVRYAKEQGYISRVPPIDELFPTKGRYS